MMASIFYFLVIFIFHEIKNCLLTPTNQLAHHINKRKFKKLKQFQQSIHNH